MTTAFLPPDEAAILKRLASDVIVDDYRPLHGKRELACTSLCWKSNKDSVDEVYLSRLIDKDLADYENGECRITATGKKIVNKL